MYNRPINLGQDGKKEILERHGSSEETIVRKSLALNACAVALVLGIGLLGVPTATAGTILDVSTGGTFAGGTQSSAWTAAGDTWTISFLVNSTPSISSSTPGVEFDLPFTNFVYTLDGTVMNVGAVDIEAFSSADLGLFSVCFFGCSASGVITNGFDFVGPQIYSGPESAPTILTGSYSETGVNQVAVASLLYTQADGTIDINTSASVPEPSTAGLSAAGLLFVAAVTFLRKRAVASTPSARR
jgi:hypothetical protein